MMKAKTKKTARAPRTRREVFADGSSITRFPGGSMLVSDAGGQGSRIAAEEAPRKPGGISYNEPAPGRNVDGGPAPPYAHSPNSRYG